MQTQRCYCPTQKNKASIAISKRKITESLKASFETIAEL